MLQLHKKGGVVANANSSYLFINIGSSVSGTVTIDGLQYFDTSETTNMYGMFYNCKGLTSIDVTKFDTSSTICLIICLQMSQQQYKLPQTQQ